MYKKMLLSSAAVLIAVVVMGPTAVLAQDKDAAEKAIDARRGFMQIVVREAGPLFGMAKGDMAYDAAAAQANADNLNALIQYDLPRLFVEGSSNADKAGKTRVLPAALSDLTGVGKALDGLRTAVANVAAEASKGQAELAGAVGEMGKACGNCHNPYRAKEF